MNDKSESVIRRCCIIIDNMCKLVDDPREGSPLLQEIYPLVEKKSNEISDPEARETCEKTLATKKLAVGKVEDVEVWKKLLGPFCSNDEKALKQLAAKLASAGEVVEEEFIDEDVNAPDLYKGSFSLAYG